MTRSGGRLGALYGAALLGPVAIAACLYPARQHVTPANLALVFVVGIVAVAGGGRRGATVVAVAASSLSFDFFLTKPYLSLRIATSADVTTTILLLVVGLAVGELAARMRSARSQVEAGRERLGRIHGLAERIAAGEEPDFVVMAVADQLRQLLFLRDCRFSHGSVTDVGARIEADGSVTMAGHDWQADKLGLPTRRVALAVRGGGTVLASFVLTPTPALPIDLERRIAAVALADQLGTSLLTKPSTR
jgi:K+-sensing histidine kinase KdpD